MICMNFTARAIVNKSIYTELNYDMIWRYIKMVIVEKRCDALNHWVTIHMDEQKSFENSITQTHISCK